MRRCTKNYKIPGEDLEIKKGTLLMVSIRGIQHDPEYYPNPDKFDPDRFSAENKKKRPTSTWLPFGDGPRICIGNVVCLFLFDCRLRLVYSLILISKTGVGN